MKVVLRYISAPLLVVALFLLSMADGVVANTSLEESGQGKVDTGGVEISFVESFSHLKQLEPGIGYYQNAALQNTGNKNVYLRVAVDFETPEGEDDLTLERLQVQWLDGWLAGGDGYYYYTKQMAQGEIVRLFADLAKPGEAPHTLVVPSEWTQTTAPKSIEMTVVPQVVQADHFPVQFHTWPYWAGL